MRHNTSVSLGAHLQGVAERLVESGRYGSISEVARAGVRLVEEHEAKVAALLQAIEEGEQSGYPSEPFDFDGFLARKQDAHGSKV